MSTDKAKELINAAKVELDQSNDQKDFKVQYHLLKAIESLSASSCRARQTTTKPQLLLVK